LWVIQKKVRYLQLQKNRDTLKKRYNDLRINEFKLIKKITTMTKAEIVNEISKSTGIEKANVLETIEKFMEVVKDSLANGENVYLRGFGSFIVKVRSEKTARNISKNETIIIPEHKIPAFKPAKVFMEEVK
jgi:DNA-binding protein HU-beta